MRNLMLSAAASIVLLCATEDQVRAETQTITVLDKGEVHDAMIFHDGHLWVGRSRENFSSAYKMQIYSSARELVAEIPLQHSATAAYAYDAQSVLVVGTGFNPNLTQYTIIKRQGSHFVPMHKVIPAGAWANKWLGRWQGREYFSDMGGNPNDQNQDFNLPAQTLFYMSGNAPRYMTTRLRMPLGGIIVGSKAYIVRHESMGQPQSYLALVDLQSQQARDINSTPYNNFTEVVSLPEHNILALSERGAGKVRLLDQASLQEVAVIDADAGVQSLAHSSKCLFVANRESRSVNVYNLENLRAPALVQTLEVDLSLDEFYSMNKMVVDTATGAIYGRSNYPCNPWVEECVRDYNRVVFLGQVESCASH
jgi:hypothetical protein